MLFTRKKKVKKQSVPKPKKQKKSFSLFFKRKKSPKQNSSSEEQVTSDKENQPIKKKSFLGLSFGSKKKSNAKQDKKKKKNEKDEPNFESLQEVETKYSQAAQDILLTKALDTRDIESSKKLFSSKKFKPLKVNVSPARAILSGVILVAIVASYFGTDTYIIKPFMDKQNAQVVKKEEQLSEIQTWESQIPGLEKGIQQFTLLNSRSYEQLFPRGGTDALFKILTEAAANHEIDMQFSRGTEQFVKINKSEENLLQQLPISLNLTGNYINYLKFRKDILTSDKYIKVEKEEITPGERGKISIAVELIILLAVS